MADQLPAAAPPPPPPALIPSGDGYTWRPQGGAPPPLQPQSIHRAPAGGQQQRRGGLVGGILAALYGLFKYGVLLLKFGKLSGTFISFGLSLLIYIGLFGWQFGLGALLLIAIHESGHMLFAKAQRLPVSAPFFLFGFGAVVTTKGFRDARQEAIVAIGGPVVGTGAALLCYLFALSLPEGNTRYLFLALAYWGCLINLFNLIPMSPLDGGRVASAVSKWANVAGIGVILLLIAGYSASGAPINPFLVIILLFGIFSTVGRFRRARAGLDPAPLPSHIRLGIGVAYAAILVISAVGMSAAHSTLLTHGIGQQIV
ncbi:MAG TPA: site-2 protease family protein [Candidatus Dormibacteraeota bacterium]|nr:site-2 protease family protein [Candidatus Dormibacteraeota bacterium]